MQLGYHTICWGGVVGDATGVTSVKDLYYRTPGSMQTAISDIAAAGYDRVEMFDGNVADYADQPAELQGLLADAGLELVCCLHRRQLHLRRPPRRRTPPRLPRRRSGPPVRRRQPGGRRRGPAGGRHHGCRLRPPSRAALDQVTDIADEHGLAACYHPHLTTIVESPDELDRLMPRTRIGFCPDTAHLAAGGGDPADLIRRYADRVRHVHLKDVRTRPFAFLPLGQGVIDFADVRSAAHEVGYDGWLLVELDSYDGDPREAAADSKTYLEHCSR